MTSRPYDRVLMIEFNELTPRLMDGWIAEGALPNFKALRDRSLRFISEADVSTPRELEPWIQWFSVHSGLAYDQHGVFHLTDGPHARHRDVFDVLGDEGLSLGCFGSMNAKGFPANRKGFYVSDPWCDGQPAQPEALATFQRFISQYVREYSNPEAREAPASAAEFLAFMVGHGLSPRTVSHTLGQLMAERVKDKSLRWKRVAILDRLSVDLFKHLHREHRPDFATFFSNSTAHLQHAYWRAMEPEAFTVKPCADHVAQYAGAIRYGYEMMDRLVGELVSLAGPRDLVIFATALSQQPFLRKEEIGGQRFYRPRDIGAMLARFGVEGATIEPVMTHQFRLRFADMAAMEQAARILEELRCDGAPMMGIPERIEDGFVIGCIVSTQVAEGTAISRAGSNETIPFFDLFYQIDGVKSGCHHPDGILWIASGEGVDRGRCSILDIFPTILAAFGKSHLLPEDRRGKSLLPAQAARRAA
jgi:hypothetical protein